ncbi:glycosyltransferase family 4 protein [Gallaecimonas sp. GXIMD4217]|uniref:glycosyltransferase family 4 protein n=1 Tax=Gallaecimonas sp. GXIMD4217 TaxID=3131927 RepID=UPI00311AF206
MHIILVGNNSDSMLNFRGSLVRNLMAVGHRVTVVCPSDANSSKLLNKLGCDFLPIKLSPKGINPLQDIALFVSLVVAFRKAKPDLIINYTIKPVIYGSLASAFCSAKCVSVTTGLGYVFINENIVSRIARLLYKVSLNFSSKVCFLNACDKEEFLKSGIIPKHKAFILPGEGVDLDHFSPTYMAPERRGGNSSHFTFIMIARALKDKGVFEYINAARKAIKVNEGVRFLFLGELGAANPSAVSKAEFLDFVAEGVVEYLGVADDVRPYISAADCVVLPSYREGLSRVLLEAAAMCKPIISSDAPGCTDVVLNGVNGFQVPVGDADGLFEAFLKIASFSEKERAEMGRKGRKLVLDMYSDEIVFQKYLSLFKGLE